MPACCWLISCSRALNCSAAVWWSLFRSSKFWSAWSRSFSNKRRSVSASCFWRPNWSTESSINAISRVFSSSRQLRYLRAASACLLSGSIRAARSSIISLIRSLFCSVCCNLRSDSSLRDLNLTIPDASSKMRRRSSERWLRTSSTRPWPTIE